MWLSMMGLVLDMVDMVDGESDAESDTEYRGAEEHFIPILGYLPTLQS